MKKKGELLMDSRTKRFIEWVRSKDGDKVADDTAKILQKPNVTFEQRLGAYAQARYANQPSSKGPFEFSRRPSPIGHFDPTKRTKHW